MYCSSCGSVVKKSLSFCNHCGYELNTQQSGRNGLSEKTQESIVWAIAVLTIVGLGGTIGLMAVMKEVLHFNDGLIIAFSLLFFLTFLTVDSVFIRLLWQSKKDGAEPTRIRKQKGMTTRDLEETPARVLPEPPMSVTEHSTRNLETVENHSNL